MLQMPQEHTEDEKANAIIAWYLNQNILDLVKDEIIEYESLQGRKATEKDPLFWDAVSDFFPDHYPRQSMGKVFLGLKALLESEYLFVPELAMEYVMYRLIERQIEISDDLGLKTLVPIPFNREYVIEVLKREYPDESKLSGSIEEDESISWQEKLKHLEDLHYYEDIYFWDMDYLQLDFHSEKELLESSVSKYLGIDNIRDESQKFVIPPEWLK